jgi:hypothetical protein
MKLKKQFVTKDIGDTQVMVAVGGSAFSGVVRSNKTAAFIVDQLKEETTKEKIVAAMLEEYDVSEERVSADVDKVLEKLRGIGALEE